MATNTYVALQTTTVTTATPTVTLSSIPQGYTDLRIVVSGSHDGAGSSVNQWRMQFNGDSTSGLYSDTNLYGTGSTAGSGRDSNLNFMYLALLGQTSIAYQPLSVFDVMNYSNSTTHKTVISRGSAGADHVNATIGLWRNTAAITSVTFFMTGQNIKAGSTFSVYGIANADNFVKATGGIISEDSTYTYHVFGSSGTFTPKQALTADILMVAGGGGGGTAAGGGGGAGGLIISSGTSLSATAYTVTVGSGGAGAAGDGNYGATGGNTTFNSWTANGGGGGAHGSNSQAAPYAYGNPGGSGGGAGYKLTYNNTGGAATQTSPSGATGYGNAGGSVSYGGGSPYYGGGGGGAGAAGTSVASATPGTGGIGRTDSFINAIGLATSTGHYSGGNWYFAGGGGGSLNDTSVPGGLGGGGAGGTATVTNANAKAQNAVANTGGGGGGGEVTGAYVGSGSKGGNGASGIVIIRYPK